MTFNHMTTQELETELQTLGEMINITDESSDSNFEAYCSAQDAVMDELKRRYDAAGRPERVKAPVKQTPMRIYLQTLTA